MTGLFLLGHRPASPPVATSDVLRGGCSFCVLAGFVWEHVRAWLWRAEPRPCVGTCWSGYLPGGLRAFYPGVVGGGAPSLLTLRSAAVASLWGLGTRMMCQEMVLLGVAGERGEAGGLRQLFGLQAASPPHAVFPAAAAAAGAGG